MSNEKYARSYTEVLEILKYLPKDEFNKIPKEKINFFEKNKDTLYEFKIDPQSLIERQNISDETNSIIITLFRDYFATEVQKEKLNNILEKNEDKYQKELREKYNPDNLFKKNDKIPDTSNKELIIYKEKNFFKKLLRNIIKIFQKRK